MSPPIPHPPEIDVQTGPDGFVRVCLQGHLNIQSVTRCWRELERKFRVSPVETLEVNATDLQSCDGPGFALLQYIHTGKMTPGATVSVVGLNAELEKRFREVTVEDYEAFLKSAAIRRGSFLEEVGSAVSRMLADLREQVAFLGSIAQSLPPALLNRKQMRWPEVLRVFELAGANAVPIVSLISVLIGLVIAFESAQPLSQFGARIYVVNMIGIIMVRELGPLMAAIMLAGRSGSAFAAEIGTMKVNEELNALETFGLDPIKFLVIQRITAGVLVTPLLTFYAAFMGVLGGVLVTLGLGFPLPLIFHQLTVSVELSDIALCGAKGVVFGAIVSAVGCLRGLQTQQGPSAVGISTTRAVVTSILLIIIADAIFSVLYYFLKS